MYANVLIICFMFIIDGGVCLVVVFSHHDSLKLCNHRLFIYYFTILYPIPNNGNSPVPLASITAVF